MARRRSDHRATTAAVTRLPHPRARRVAELAMTPPTPRSDMRRITPKDRVEARRRREKKALSVEWQKVAYQLVRDVGELGYLVNSISETVSQGRLAVTALDDNGERLAPENADQTKLGEAEEVLRNLVGPKGGHEALLKAAAEHDWIAGEAHLLGTINPDTDALEWEFLSVFEVTEDARGRTLRQRRPDMERVEIPDDSYIARYLRPDPEFSDMACSTVQRVLPIAAEIHNLDLAIKAAIDAKRSQAALYLPNEINFDRADDRPVDPDPATSGDDLDPLEEAIYEHMTDPLGDPGSSARFYPFIVRGPGEHFANTGLIDLARDVDISKLQADRDASIHRLATSLDIPPEKLEGLSLGNHWSAYEIAREFMGEAVPVGQRIAQFLTNAYLRRMLVDFYGWDPVDAGRFVVEFDASELEARADETVNSRALWDRMLISDEAIIRAHGFDPEVDRLDLTDLANQAGLDEVRLRLVMQLIAKAPVTGVNSGAYQLLGVPLTMSNGGSGSGGERDYESDADADSGDVPGDDEDIDAVSGMEEPPREEGEGLESLAAEVRGLAEGALERVLERAHARLLNASQRHPDLRERIRLLPDGEALAALSADEWRRLGVQPERLLSGGWDRFQLRVRNLIRQHLETGGCDPWLADEIATARTSTLVMELDGLAQQAFRRPLTVDGQGRRIPAAVFDGLLTPAEVEA